MPPYRKVSTAADKPGFSPTYTGRYTVSPGSPGTFPTENSTGVPGAVVVSVAVVVVVVVAVVMVVVVVLSAVVVSGIRICTEPGAAAQVYAVPSGFRMATD